MTIQETRLRISVYQRDESGLPVYREGWLLDKKASPVKPGFVHVVFSDDPAEHKHLLPASDVKPSGVDERLRLRAKCNLVIKGQKIQRDGFIYMMNYSDKLYALLDGDDYPIIVNACDIMLI